MKYISRFEHGFAPETGKKADLMFVQHMLASCKKKGKVVVVMPHGVLFRGGKEKEIREGLLRADVLEGIISLPPQLFYGTGIPACIMVFNKSKPDNLKNKVFIISADKDYAEGKKQNSLRPEDIEKIDYVFSNKIEENNYSRLVDFKTIEDNEFTLNIRRYVDNTPPPEPEDVKAHLIGGVPVSEIKKIQSEICHKFNFDGHQLFREKNGLYKDFVISEKAEIKKIVDEDKAVDDTLLQLGMHLADWWQLAKDDFSSLAPEKSDLTVAEGMAAYVNLSGSKFPEVRKELLNTMKEKFVPVGILDKFQVAGVFVNWWDNIKYDLKTIMQNGWDAGLIPDEYLIESFFKAEQVEIEQLEITQAEHETNLEEAVEEALGLLEYELDQEKEEKATPTLAKKELKTQIVFYLKEKKKPEEAKPYQEAESKIKDLESSIKVCKSQLKEKLAKLELKLILKRYGSEDQKAESQKLLQETKKELTRLDQTIAELIAGFKVDLKDKKDYAAIKKSTTVLEKELKKSKAEPDKLQALLEAKKQFKVITKAYNSSVKDQGILEAKLKSFDKLLFDIGGIITEEESQRLILKKHFDIINNQLQRYLNAEKRTLIAAYENLYDKYFTSAQAIEAKRNDTMAELNDFLTQLKYLK